LSAADPQCRFEAVCSETELRRGRMKSCRVGGQDVVICRTSAGLFALSNECTHAAARMSEGRLRDQRLICPLHGAAFDVRDGRSLSAPATLALPTHELRVREGIIEVRLRVAAPTEQAG
jgi:nitrite reductase/ring-hydroxylating ferredoxin subunit